MCLPGERKGCGRADRARTGKDSFNPLILPFILAHLFSSHPTFLSTRLSVCLSLLHFTKPTTLVKHLDYWYSLRAELCLPQNVYVDVLAPGAQDVTIFEYGAFTEVI